MPELAVLETGIPIPTPKRVVVTQFGRVIDALGTIDAIQVGQSFTVDDADMRLHVLNMGLRKSVKLTSKKQPDGRFKIWRKE